MGSCLTYRKHEDGPKVLKELALFECEPGSKDDGRQQRVKEGGRGEAQRLRQACTAQHSRQAGGAAQQLSS